MALVRFFYNLVFPFVLVALLPGFAVRIFKRGKYRHKFGQRFAIYSERVQARLSQGGATWVHAVSVGEVLIALKLIRELKQQDPSLRVVLSTTTSTGFALADKEKSDWLEPIYNPIDFYGIARRAMRLIRPKQFILVEAEVWPNLTAEAKAVGATVALVNARLSPRSEKRYSYVRPITAALFNQLDILCVQEPTDAERWKALGVRPEKIVCTGSIKFDDARDDERARRDFRPLLKELGVAADVPILLAGSTHAGEERILGEIFLKLRESFPTLFYVAVPRHAERWKEIRDSLKQIGVHMALRNGENDAYAPFDGLIVNSTGELRDWYDCATLVFVGKSLTAKGGQNPAEAIAAGKAVVFGPHMENFPTLSAQLVREQGAIQVADAEALESTLRSLLSDSRKQASLAANGAKCLAGHRGATARTVQQLRSL